MTKITDNDCVDRYSIYVVDGLKSIGWITKWKPPRLAEVSFDFRSARKFTAEEAALARETLNRFGVMNGVFSSTDIID